MINIWIDCAGYGAKRPSIDGNEYYHKREVFKKKPAREEAKVNRLAKPKISRLDCSSPEAVEQKHYVIKFKSYLTFVKHMKKDTKDFKNYIKSTSQPFLFNNNGKRRFPSEK